MRTGKILDVYSVPMETLLAQDSDTDADLIYLEDASWFNEDGGYAYLDDDDDEKFLYTAADFDLDTLTVDTASLVTTHTEGAIVRVHPRQRVRYATVKLDGDIEEGPARVRVPMVLTPILRVGTRDPDSDTLVPESVLVEIINDEWYIIDVLGSLPALTEDHAPSERIFRYRAGDLETDHVSIGLNGYRGTAYAARAVCATAPTALAHLELRHAGNVVETLAIPAGKTKSQRYTFTETFKEDESWRVKHTDPENMGTDVYVYVYVKLQEDQ